MNDTPLSVDVLLAALAAMWPLAIVLAVVTCLAVYEAVKAHR